MFPNMGAHPGHHYDRFLYAAMLSRAKIEQAWSGNAEDPEAKAPEPKVEETQAFDPEMLKKLAQKAADGDVPEQPAFPASASSSSANIFSGFSSAVIEAARPLMKPSTAMMAPCIDDDESNPVPLAFRPKKPKVPLEAPTCDTSSVPLAFLKKKVPAPPAASSDQSGNDRSGGNDPSDPSKPSTETSSVEDLKKEFQDQMQHTQKLFQEAQAQMGEEPNGQSTSEATADAKKLDSRWDVAGARPQVVPPPPPPYTELIRPHAANHENDAKNNAAVANIVSATLEKAKRAVEATRTFHAAAPEAADASKDAPKRSKWDEDSRPLRVDTSDPTLAASGDKISKSNAIPTLRELSALARGEPNPDAPVLGELRAPGSTQSAWIDPNASKTGAQVAREQRARAMGHQRGRSRSGKRKRARSPSSSPERNSKRLFTDKPSFRMTGSSFSAASTKPAEKKEEKMPDFKKDDLPDWLKDLADPKPPAQQQVVMGKKYLHMPRLMIEVLTHNGGEAIRACIEKSGAQIRVETTIEEPVGIISVNGAVNLGEQCIREMLANKGLNLPPQDGLVLPFKPVDPNKETNNLQDVQIPSELVRHFVGHRGCNLKAITAKLGHAVSIQILPSILPGGFQRIQISGSNRKEARNLVLQHIEDLKRQKNLTLWGDNRDRQQPQQPLPPPPPPIPTIQGVSI